MITAIKSKGTRSSIIDPLRHHQLDVSQAWFADDTTAAGQLPSLLQWWKQLLSLGPLYGYYPNATKTYFIVKLQLYDSAKQLFQDNDIQVTCHSQCHLDAAIGSWLFTGEYVSFLVKTWSDVLLTLSSISESYLIVLIVHLFMV